MKGGNEGKGWFGEVTADYLREWAALRVTLPDFNDTLFISVGGIKPYTSLTVDGLRKILKELGRKCGIPDVNVHCFRRGFAVALSTSGVPDNILKDLGRWEDTKMIKRYTAAQQASRVYQNHAPMDKLNGKLT